MMKHLPIIFLFFFSLKINAQFELEQSYEQASVFEGNLIEQQFYMVNLEVDGMKYVHVDVVNSVVTFYNLDHSFWKSISLENTTDVNELGDVSKSVLYITQHLFDLDDEIELMYVDIWNTNAAVTQIVNEDGSILFTEMDAMPGIKANVPQVQEPIYNTPNGTKMILSLLNGNANVYSLSGMYNELVEISNDDFLSVTNPFPNPAKHTLSLSYEFPSGIHSGSMSITDAKGSILRTQTLNSNTALLTIDLSGLISGIYIVTLYSNDNLSIARKVFKIDD